MKNIYTMGNHFTKDEIYPAIVEFMKIHGGEVSNREINAFIVGRFGIYFGNLSEVVTGLREYDKRIVRVRRGVSQYIDDQGNEIA